MSQNRRRNKREIEEENRRAAINLAGAIAKKMRLGQAETAQFVRNFERDLNNTSQVTIAFSSAGSSQQDQAGQRLGLDRIAFAQFEQGLKQCFNDAFQVTTTSSSAGSSNSSSSTSSSSANPSDTASDSSQQDPGGHLPAANNLHGQNDGNSQQVTTAMLRPEVAPVRRYTCVLAAAGIISCFLIMVAWLKSFHSTNGSTTAKPREPQNQ